MHPRRTLHLLCRARASRAACREELSRAKLGHVLGVCRRVPHVRACTRPVPRVSAVVPTRGLPCSSIQRSRTFVSTRMCCVANKAEPVSQDEREQEVSIYQGPFATSIRRVKLFSISSFVLTSFGTPLLVYFSDADLSVLHKWAVGSLVIGFGFLTTATLNWMFKPYVRQMWYRPQSNPKTVRLETLNVLGQPKNRVVKLLDMNADTMRPMATFKDTSSGAHFFLHAEVVTAQPSLRPILKHVIAFPTPQEVTQQTTVKQQEEEQEDEVNQEDGEHDYKDTEGSADADSSKGWQR